MTTRILFILLALAALSLPLAAYLPQYLYGQ